MYGSPGSSYKFIAQTSAGVTVWTQDNIGAVPTSTVNVDISFTAGESLSAGALIYLSDGSGGLTAGSGYKADADLNYASVTPVMGFVVDAVASGDTGTMRTDGQIELAGPLTPGAIYYASATAGAVTSTAPTFARQVGQAQSTTLLAIAVNPPQNSVSVLEIEVFT